MSHASDMMFSNSQSGFDAQNLRGGKTRRRSRRHPHGPENHGRSSGFGDTTTGADGPGPGSSLLASPVFWIAGVCSAGVSVALIVAIYRLL
jgi:hypothetical protein